MEILEKFNSINKEIHQLEVNIANLVEQAKLLQPDIVQYLKDETNSLEERFVLYKSLPLEMLKEDFCFYSNNSPQGFELFAEDIRRSCGQDLIKNIPSFFASHFDDINKKINYKSFANEFMNEQHENEEESKNAVIDAYNFAIINVIGSIY